MSKNPDKSQIDKFRDAARELGTDDSEKAFDDKLRRVAKSQPPKNNQKSREDDS